MKITDKMAARIGANAVLWQTVITRLFSNAVLDLSRKPVLTTAIHSSFLVSVLPSIMANVYIGKNQFERKEPNRSEFTENNRIYLACPVCSLTQFQ